MANDFLHQVKIVSSSDLSEQVHEKFVLSGLLKAQQKTRKVLLEIRDSLATGMTEDDARKLSLDIFAKHGVTKHWHKPYIRFGQGTALTFHEPLQKEYRLSLNDPFYIDLGPVWTDPELGLEYEGDLGDTFVLGSNEAAQACAHTARELFKEAKEQWQTTSCTGEELCMAS